MVNILKICFTALLANFLNGGLSPVCSLLSNDMRLRRLWRIAAFEGLHFIIQLSVELRKR